MNDDIDIIERLKNFERMLGLPLVKGLGDPDQKVRGLPTESFYHRGNTINNETRMILQMKRV